MIKQSPANLKLSVSIIFSCLFLLCSLVSLALAQNDTIIRVNVGVVLDDLKYSLPRKIWLSCINMGVSDFYASHVDYHTKLVLNTRHSKKSVVDAASAALDLIKNKQVQAIIGPVTSMQTSFVINLGDQAHVPILSFSATSPSLTSLRSSYFFQFAQIDSSQVKAICAVVEAFGWKQVVLIYVDTNYGVGVIPYLTDALQEVDARVLYRSVISPSATNGEIVEEFNKLMMMETRVFIVHMTIDLSLRVFSKAKEMGMMSEGYVWLTTSGVTNSLNSQNSSVINSMQGVLGIQTYVPQTVELEEFKLRWKRHFRKDNPTISGAELDVYGLWAYDAVFALAMAIERVNGTASSSFGPFGFQQSNASNKLTDLESLPISPNGPELHKALSNIRFEGITGDFSLVDDQRQSSTFQIINVNGGGARTIGFWKLQNGLMKTLNSSAISRKVSSSKSNLGRIMWPGGTLSVPKGWEIPTKGKKLRIGVPVKVDFTEFVNVTKDPNTNTTHVTGFSIDVFKAVVDLLPYDLPYEFIPFANANGTSAGTYNDLCHQVNLGKFDAVVGDTTIRAERSLYVDFTMPYTQSAVVIVMPVIDLRSKSSLAFLSPWRLDLWLTTCFFFIYIGFVVWVLEHRINKHFRGPPSHQVGASVWFSCSAMVFAHRERVVSNLARFVMIIWVFVVLILTINYTASLSSLYTLEQIQPDTDIMDLLRKGDNVGYVKNSFVYDLLKQIGFDDSKLNALVTMEEIDEALTKGSAKGGISAVVHETPMVKLFLAKYCSKYAMIGPIFETDGFAFVFPKQSPLRRDVSQAVLNVTGGDQIMKIEKAWLHKQSNCQIDSFEQSEWSTPPSSSRSLGLESFWVLFLIAGLASILALIIFVASFIYKHRPLLMQPGDSGHSTWSKAKVMFELFDQNDLSCHTFKSRSQPRNNSNRSGYSNSLFNGEQQTNMIDQASANMQVPATIELITIQEMQRTSPHAAATN